VRAFAFRLVRQLGGMTVDEFLARVSSRELTEWMAFCALEAKEQALIKEGMPLDAAMQAVWGTDLEMD
jgi:hypothetical protein